MLNEGQTAQWRYDQSYAHYKPLLMALADSIWEDFGVPLVAAPISLHECDWENPDCSIPDSPSRQGLGVHDATIDAAAEHPHILRGPNTDDLRIGTNGHIWDVNELGVRWVDAVEVLID